MNENSIPENVMIFIKEAKAGKEYVSKNGIPESVNNNVYKAMFYAINENIVDRETREWIIWNADEFALLWLFNIGGKND